MAPQELIPNSPPSDSEEQTYPSALASSLAGLPLSNASEASTVVPPKAQSAQLKDFLDLADGTTRLQGTSSTDISSRLELKRLEHERQRALQKAAFEEQMRQLELQQEREEQELLERGPSTNGEVTSTDPTVSGGARPRTGNDLTPFSATEGTDPRRRADYANAKSMPGSRRHSGEINPEEVATEGRRGQKQGDGPMLNSFIFDDELDADLQNSAWGGKYLQMNTDDDKFPILIRRDSYPGILSASSAALDLAPLPQTSAARGFRSNEGRAGASEWPQFQSQSRPIESTESSLERHRTVTHGTVSIDTTSSGDRASPRPRGTGAGQLPPPRSSMGTGGVTASGRSSPSVEKKLETNKPKGYQAEGAAYVDTITDQFSNFNIDSNAFGADSNQGPFGGYGAHDGAFAYDGSAGPYGGMGKSVLYGVDDPVQQSETNRFAGLRLEDLQGDMLPLCKDQFGCRYLQKKLEDGNPEHRDMIFNEIFPHFAELMTDPFANYLSQRLLEYSTDEQRDALIESISGELVTISLNMHGTRAVQKMIDYLSTQRQVQSLILALNLNVVTLIKDLNGNHVIQKCLNHLPPEDNQFIYNAVATHCIEVATHRHGCCVLQRCIDHASESQRIQLVTEITYNSLTLVQDAFGNYVVQYVLDLNDNRFIEAIVRQFLGNVSALSAQKFSSNVVEKCIRVADASGRRAIIDELLNKQRLERLLRDSFANYVVQTALDYAEPAQRAQLIETIRPILPMIRNTPYGKRIQSKIQRETSDHMSRTAYHPALIPGGYPNQGHFNGQNGLQHPPHQFMQQHHQQMMNQQMSLQGDFRSQQGSPYLGGGGGMQQGGMGMGMNMNMGMGGMGGGGFAPFQGGNGGGGGGGQNGGANGQQNGQGMNDYGAGGYAPFM